MKPSKESLAKLALLIALVGAILYVVFIAGPGSDEVKNAFGRAMVWDAVEEFVIDNSFVREKNKVRLHVFRVHGAGRRTDGGYTGSVTLVFYKEGNKWRWRYANVGEFDL